MLCSLAYDPAQHEMEISSLSWSPRSDKIVTCGHDRNGFVFSFDASLQKWVPTLCVFRLDRGCLDVAWTPDGHKFAVSCSSKTVAVCYYDNAEGNDWYISHLMKKHHKSAVLQVAWHPNSQILATACADGKVREPGQ